MASSYSPAISYGVFSTRILIKLLVSILLKLYQYLIAKEYFIMALGHLAHFNFKKKNTFRSLKEKYLAGITAYYRCKQKFKSSVFENVRMDVCVCVYRNISGTTLSISIKFDTHIYFWIVNSGKTCSGLIALFGRQNEKGDFF
ncbi:hypothetical protein TSAR_002919 [Trichomalopsis sarcophagae]|uniref:Uncharacterized protein n=1 Tax=Trichomalopsis sarcophagae TaxID=543379 RepID=A0A232ERL6_9HYME|nr:hypothetical protein TSAR_002919 [Trichomalopsis sarcophagae]